LAGVTDRLKPPSPPVAKSAIATAAMIANVIHPRILAARRFTLFPWGSGYSTRASRRRGREQRPHHWSLPPGRVSA